MNVTIETEIFKNLFVSICEEMGISLMKTAFSPNIKERRDYSTAIFNEAGETIAQGDHMPVHLGAMPISVQTVIRSMKLRDGDMVLLNDPFQGGTHLPDFTLIQPVFYHSTTPVFYLANRAHHSDVGGMSAGSMPLATEIFQEGLIIPPVILVRRNRIQDDLLHMILANVRTPEERLGDLRSQIAANRVGARSLIRLMEKYGPEKVRKYGTLLQEYTETIVRRCIAAIPDGIYMADDVMDGDGIENRRVPLSVTVTVQGDEAEIDFSRSGSQTRGNINANYAITFAATVFVFRSLIDEEIPYNSGIFRPLRIVTRPGTIVDSRFPAAVAGGNVETSQRVVDLLLKALHPVLPGSIPAASQGTMNNISFGGQAEGLSFAYYETLGGGMGASAEADGLSGVHSHMTNSLNTPIEALENYLPVRITEYRLRRGSGGMGKRSGGEGLVREYEFLSDVRVTVLSERRNTAPYGLEGGADGRCGLNGVVVSGKTRWMEGKFAVDLKAHDRLRVETPGGGGYGRLKKE